MKVNAVIFDMDGLVFDTEMIYYQATQIVADEMGFPYDKELYLNYLGVSDKEVWAAYRKIFAAFGEEKVESFIQASFNKTIELFSTGKVPLKPGVLELLDYLEQKEIPKVIASSNQRHIIEMLLEQKNILHRFDEIVSSEDVHRAKPDPEIFIIAQENLGIAKHETLILEDSHNGVLAASAAGIPVVMVPDLMPATTTLKEKSLAVVASLHDIPQLINK